jgi:hypothetical protein
MPRPIVDELRLADEADAVLLSFEVGVAKPDAGIYQAALDALGRATEGVFVDDQAVLRGRGGARHPVDPHPANDATGRGDQRGRDRE